MLGCRLVARLPDASRKAEEYAALGMFQEAAETAATVSTQPLVLCYLLVTTASEYLNSIAPLSVSTCTSCPVIVRDNYNRRQP